MKHYTLTRATFFLFLTIFAVLSGITSSCLARDFSYEKEEEEEQKVTGEEKAVFAYFKLGKKSPDYEKWIQSSSGYKNTSEGKKIQYLLQESLRLDAGFGNYNLSEDPLIISLDVMVKITSPDKDNKSFLYTEFSGIDMSNDQIPSFNFPYADESVVLVVFEITRLGEMPLTPKQVENMTKQTDEKDSYFPAKLDLHIIPSEADHQTPVISDTGKIMWLMSGKIAYMRCSFDDMLHNVLDRQLWDYVAPWYKEIYDEKNKPKEIQYPDPFENLKKR